MTVAAETGRKRLTKAERVEARREAGIAEAQRLAALLSAAPPETEGSLAPPAFIADPRLAPAAAVWRELVPQLEKSGRLHRLDRDMFAALCYWRAEWIAAVDDILTNGYSFMGKAVAGGSRPWTNPAVERRDTAWGEMMSLSAKFGLTPLDRLALGKGQRDGFLDDPDLFGTPRKVAAAAASEAPVPTDKWSSLLDGPAPQRPN